MACYENRVTPKTPRPWLDQYNKGIPASLGLPSASMIDLFEATARHKPAAPGLYYFDDPISWAQLDHKANQFAALLADWGVGHGDRVALSLQNDPDFVIAQYGVWKRGAIVVPLSPMFKGKEIAYQLKDCGAQVYICRDEIFESQANQVLGGTDIRHVLLTGEFDKAISRYRPDEHHRLSVTPDDIAYLVYTSGTTGFPKGSISLHRNIAFNADVFRTWYSVGEDDVILGAAPLFHITGIVAQMALSALAGVPLILYYRFDPGETLRLIEKWKATFAVAVITAWIALLKEAEGREVDIRCLNKCGSGGAPTAPALVDEFQRRFGVLIHNTYGLTESNSPSHLTPMGRRGPVDPASGALAIGLPVPNCDAQVVDLSDPSRCLEPGEAGELALKGPMMFPGYWQKGEATAAAHCDGWFLTGDVAVMDREGWFYLVDRKKDMIICSGFKVWPREVEDVLYQHPAVREAAVIGVPDGYRGETVKAVIALRQGHESLHPEEIIEFCKSRLASYKYPRQVEFMDEIPKTASGKFLRRQLRDR